MERDWEVQIRHIYHEGNAMANGMANYAKHLEHGWYVFDHPPDDVRQVLYLGSTGSYCNRMISNHGIPLL